MTLLHFSSRTAVCVAILSAASSLRAPALTVDAGGPANAGVFSSAAIVAGRPAIAWSDDQNLAVKYVRALDANGSAWGTPVTVDAGPEVGAKVCLLTVNGFPAVCCFD